MSQLTAATQGEIDAWEIAEEGVKDGSSPSMMFDVGGSTATRKFFCRWESRYEVARWFVGAVDSYLVGSTLMLSRLNPQQLPLPAGSPLWVPRFHATKVTEITGHCWEGNDPDDPDPYQFTDETLNRFTHAKLTVQFERLPFALLDDVEAEPEIRRNVQFIPEDGQPDYITVPSSTQLYIDSGGSLIQGSTAGHLVPVPYPVGITESVYRFCLRWHRLPYSCYGPGSALTARLLGDGTTANLPYINAVNDAPFYYDTYPAGTVMLEKVTERLDPSLLDSSVYLWTVDYHFAVKPAGWNTQWFFPNTTGFTGAANAARRLLVGRGVVHYAAGAVPDLYSNYIERDFDLLFDVDG